jgi:hypothetical protein
MAQFLFTLLAMFSGASIGGALFATWCLYKLRRLTSGNRRRWYLYMILVKIGVAGTFGTLLVVVIPTASINPSLRAWAYIGFLVVAAYGLIGMAAVTADELASAESRTDEGTRKENENIRETRTTEDKKRASLRGWEDDTRFTTEEPSDP